MHERGTSAEKRYKRSNRRSPTSSHHRRHHNKHRHHTSTHRRRETEHSRRSYSSSQVSVRSKAYQNQVPLPHHSKTTSKYYTIMCERAAIVSKIMRTPIIAGARCLCLNHWRAISVVLYYFKSAASLTLIAFRCSHACTSRDEMTSSESFMEEIMFFCQRTCDQEEPEYIMYSEPIPVQGPSVFYDSVPIMYQPLEQIVHYPVEPVPAPRRRPSQIEDPSVKCIPRRRRPSHNQCSNNPPAEPLFRRQSLQDGTPTPRVRRRPLQNTPTWGDLESTQRQVCELSLSGGPGHQQMAMVESSWWPVVEPPPLPPLPPLPVCIVG